MQPSPSSAAPSQTEFPRDLLELLRCHRDDQPLAVEGEPRLGPVGIVDARLRCPRCGATLSIEGGIARLLDGGLSAEDAHEITLRDAEYAGGTPAPFVPPATGWRSATNDRIEIAPFLAELEPLRDRLVLEIGCGDGRLTMLMAQRGARVLAVDFSLNALRKMAGWLPSGMAPTGFPQTGPAVGADLRGRIGLVQANASRLRLAPRRFDRALSTTPLDSREQRLALYHTTADALADDGRFIGSVEHDDLLHRAFGQPLARRYEAGGIFIEHFDRAAVHRECAPYFHAVRLRPIRPYVPLARRLPPRSLVPLSRLISALPGLRELGQILLFRAERPVRPPVEGTRRPGNRLVKALSGWYDRLAGRRAGA
jgi:SAM-dependent methyltransferase